MLLLFFQQVRHLGVIHRLVFVELLRFGSIGARKVGPNVVNSMLNANQWRRLFRWIGTAQMLRGMG